VLDSSLELTADPNLPSARGASMPMMTVFWSLRGEEGRLQLGKQLSLSGARPVEPVIWDGLMDAPSLQLVIGSINTHHHCGYRAQRGLIDTPSLQLVIGSINTRHHCGYRGVVAAVHPFIFDLNGNGVTA